MDNIPFTYSGYRELLTTLRNNGYSFNDYHNCDNSEKCVILRHDIDNTIDKALQLAKLEANESVHSTYFVLLTSDFYNVASAENTRKIREIIALGHEIGLHFDEIAYQNLCCQDLINKICDEAEILSKILHIPITTVSMHRPSQMNLSANYHIPNIINACSQKFFHEYKYLSDSRRRWREPVLEIIKSECYNKLHILTHAFWYNSTEVSLYETLNNFITSASHERFCQEEKNITDIKSIFQLH